MAWTLGFRVKYLGSFSLKTFLGGKANNIYCLLLPKKKIRKPKVLSLMPRGPLMTVV